MLDVDFVRQQFPALDDDWAFFDNAGGSVPAAQVIDRVTAYMRRYGVQLGASYPRSVEAVEEVTAGKAAMASLFNAAPEEVVLNGSTTINAFLLARAIRPLLEPGDRIVVTNLDHEANIGAWRRLEAEGIEIAEWPFSLDDHRLHFEQLEPLLNDRTRLVSFTHCANVVGSIHDVADLGRRIHDAGALVCVDGVAYAPHRRVDFAALDVDFYLASLYKVYGPHQGVMLGKAEHLRRLENQNHHFIPEDQLAYRLAPGNVNHELTASLPGILEYLETIDARHAATDEPEVGARLDRVFRHIAKHEERLVEPLLDYLESRDDVRILGERSPAAGLRVPTVAFTVDGRHASDFPTALDDAKIAIRWGDFYARRAIEALDLTEAGGVVRVSMVHYNSLEEVERLIEALDRVL